MAIKTRADEFLSPTLEPRVTGGESDLPTTYERERERNEAYWKAWQQMIDYRLIDWGSSPGQFDDDGVEPPGRETILHAIDLAKSFQSQGLPPPDSVVPDANGGIVFERREQDDAEVLHVWSDGTVEYQRFHGTRLVERSPL